MAGRYTAQERLLRRKEALLSLPPKNHQAIPPPQPAPPPYPSMVLTGDKIPKKRSTYGLQRDYRVLEREKKVSTTLENSDFRLKLENILQGQLEGKDKPKSTRPPANQWLEDLGNRRVHPDSKHQAASGAGYRENVIPINDLGGIQGSKYTLAQRQTRCKLASVYRLVDIFGWSQTIHNHITACVPSGGSEGYLVNAFGLTYQEVTASNLVQVDFEGNISDPGSTQLGVNEPGLLLHSALHKARRNIKCAIHIRSNATVAMSAVDCGLLPISSEATAIGKVSYFDCWEVEREDIEDEIAMALGTSKVLVLHNDGAVAMGETIEEAFSVALQLVKACEIQIAAMPAGLGNLKQNDFGGVWSRGRAGKGRHKQAGVEWKAGELEFEALMRMLDNKGYRTGYDYRGLDLLQPGQSEEDNKPKSSDADDKGVEHHHKMSEKELLNDADPNTNDRLDSLKIVAEKVAQSTGESFQKLSQREHDSLDLAKQTAERIAKSTGNSLKTLEDHHQREPVQIATTTTEDDQPQVIAEEENGLERAAKKVAQTTSKHVVEAVANEKESELNLMELTKQTAEQVANSTSHSMQRLIHNQSHQDADRKDAKAEPTPPPVKEQRQSAEDTSAVASVQHAQVHLSPANDNQRTLPSLPPAVLGGQLEVPVPVSPANGSQKTLPSLPPAVQLENHDTRTLPAVPTAQIPNGYHHQSPPHTAILGSNTRKLPVVPPMKSSAEAPVPIVQILSNGYNHTPVVTKGRNQWARSLDSMSEYSTTESEAEQTPLAVPWMLGHAEDAVKDRDLETNPLKRVSHTAEMVAESTGKAVHKLNTTLPKY